MGNLSGTVVSVDENGCEVKPFDRNVVQSGMTVRICSRQAVKYIDVIYQLKEIMKDEKI